MDKKYLVGVLIYVVTGFLALSLIAFVIYHLAGMDESSYTTAVARASVAERAFEGDGWIFRDEIPLESEGDGSVYSPLQDGENVAAGDEVASLYDSNPEALTQLNECDRLLKILREANVSSSLAECTAKVRSLGAEIRRAAADGDSAAIAALINDLQTALDKRNNVSGAVQNFDKEISRVESERTAILSTLGRKQQSITAPVAGNYRKKTDGYEQIFSFALTDTLDPASFERLLSSLGFPEGSSAGKICVGSLWKLLITADSEDAVLLSAGKNYDVVFTDCQISMKLDRISSDHKTNKTLLVFSSRVDPPKSLARRERVRIVTYAENGLRIPTAALRCPEEEGGQVGVYVQSGNRIRFKKVEILTHQDGFYVVRAFPSTDTEHAGYLKENDIVLTSGKELTEGYLR